MPYQSFNLKRLLFTALLTAFVFYTLPAEAKGGKCSRRKPCYAVPITIALHQSETITISAKDFYSYMSVKVKKGEVYSFLVMGQYKYKDFMVRTTADGWNNGMLETFGKNGKRMKNAACFSLCGAIGKNEDNHFRIGSRLQNHTMKVDGNLHFFANDHKNFYWNNKGCLMVKITREL